MASRQEFGAQPRRRMVTYGKASKKSSSISRPSQERIRPGVATEAPSIRQQQTTAAPPNFDFDNSSPEPLSLDAQMKNSLPSYRSQKTTGSERKRKVSQIYSANEQGQDPLSEGSSPVGPKSRRSRVSSPIDGLLVGDPARSPERRAPSGAAHSADLNRGVRSLSSPPPTPIVPKERRVNGIVAPKKDIPFSPGTMQILDGLKVSGSNKKPRQQQMPVRLANNQPSRPKPSNVPSTSTEGKPEVSRRHKEAAPKPAKRPRKKLIDALVEQMEEDQSDDQAEESSEGPGNWTDSVAMSSQASNTTMDSQQPPPQTPKTRRIPGSGSVRTFARTGSSLKYTYGQSRVTMLEEDNLLDAFALPELPDLTTKARRLELGLKKPALGFDFEDDDPDSTASPRGKMRDIHEIRQAGANSRVADEMVDLSYQIGAPTAKPSSSRRTALLQIAEKAGSRDYQQRLRDHSMDTMILKHIGTETDIISGYLITAILSYILVRSKGTTSLPILQLLHDEEAGSLFSRLIECDEDIKKLVRDRKMNLSKRTQGAFISLEAALQELWQSSKPLSISPRTIALKCLDLLTKEDPTMGCDISIFPEAVTNGLFEILKVAEQAGFWNDAATSASEIVNVECALSALEFHAVKALESEGQGEQLEGRFLPGIADAFGHALRSPLAHTIELKSLLLKLVLNMTNSSLTAPDIFVRKGLLPILSNSICSSFSQALAALTGDGWSDVVLEDLVLKLGILINFAEKSMTVRKAVFESPGDNSSPMQQLIQLFLANHRATSEADSEAKSQMNVAFGYLSVLLGYLALYPPVRHSFKTSHSAKSLGPLIDSIGEFIQHHRAMEASLLDAGVDDPRAHGGYTERLQALCDQLETDAAYD
ncbi:hypothetical protein BX600DRAFT_298798 [Xylariales sp. PMI_506]|nr:hypothetical protein BX600DRAFT_298798 [Xylariales sp. PMI_506]